ncbi:spore coat protein [Oceanobacillus luteolus]|uniref:Spore coat protein n=1 Tax=Oceanobacillus luteolus TaxID=1274358 RepID=A0ABW4HXC9_9BACI|nr:spore coat protein [Oceanobacillus luteolus]MCM3740862.1 spore coat protein [Oceanobacillus luteolus]
MSVFRNVDYYDIDHGRDRYSYFDDTAFEGTRRNCGCGDHCGCKSSHEFSNHQSVESNFQSNNDAFELQDGAQLSWMDQESAEVIWVKESCHIKVNTTDTQIGVSLQAALQLAIALVLNISIADGQQRDAVSQELTQQFNMAQKNKQKILIYNTKDANVTTKDTDLAINIQLMLQVLIALVLLVDIL